MKLITRLLLVLFIVLAILVAGILAIPYLYKDQIIAFTKEEINKNVYAKVDFEDADLSILSTFPNLNLSIQNYNIQGIEAFENTLLAKGKTIDLELDLLSIVKSGEAIKVNSIKLDQPFINLLILKSGKANYDIAVPTDERIKETASETDYSKFVVDLDSYELTDGELIYEDRTIDNYTHLKGVNHSGTGQFTIDIYDLITTTKVEQLDVVQDGIQYLKNAKADLDAIINIDQKNAKYTLKDNELKLNEFKLNAEGFVQLIEEDIYMDLKVNSPQNEFKDFLSLIPNAFIEGYEDVKADGSFKANGLVRGNYNAEKESFPAFQLSLDIENANVKYPDLPLGISNIAAKIGINSPSSNFDEMVINVPQLRMKVGNNPIDAQFLLKTPVSDPDIDTKIKGVLNLEELTKAFPVEGYEDLSGIINADIEAKTKMSYIDQEAYKKVNMRGDLQVKDMVYQLAEYPAINIHSMDMAFNPEHVDVKSFDAKLGKSDVQASGTIDNILAFFSPEKTMTGDLKLRSKYFLADEWLDETESSTTVSSGSSDSDYEVFDRFDFEVDGKIEELAYDVYELKNLEAKGKLSPSRMEIDHFEMLIGKSDIEVEGEITNVFPYVFDGETLGGKIQFESAFLDLNQFMTEDGSTFSSTAEAETEVEPILVPANIDMTISSRIAKVLYNKMELRDLKGDLIIADEAVVLDEVEADGLGGEITMSGAYNTQDRENPGFEIKYDLQKLDFQETFENFNTFEKLAPIGKFLKGDFTSTLIMDGKLGNDLIPKFSSLNAQGYLQTLNAVLTSFKPLEAVGNKLNIKEFKEDLKIKGTKNWFEIKDGKVEIKEFDYAWKEIDMKIGGWHGIDQDMDYGIKAKIPRAMMEKSAVGSAANSGLDALTSQANKLGLNIKQSEFLNVMINLTGSIKEPKVKFNLLGAEGEASLADAAKDKAKEELNKEKEKLQQEAEKKADKLKKEVTDSAKTVVNQELEKAKDKLEKEGEKLGESIGNEVKDKATEVLGEKGKEEADKIKNALEDFNPFKKKKKKDDGGGN